MTTISQGFVRELKRTFGEDNVTDDGDAVLVSCSPRQAGALQDIARRSGYTIKPDGDQWVLAPRLVAQAS